jgi:putative aldouronate transport system permease protein
MAITIVTTIPIVMVYPFLQKYFIKGMLVGSMKG